MEKRNEYKLGDILTIKYGKDHKQIADGDVPIYGSGGIIRYGERSLYDGPSILIPRKGSLNNIMFADKPFWTVDTMFWTIINEDIANPLFVYYSICKKDFASLNVGSAVPSLTVPVIENIDILLPSRDTQDKVVAVLKSLDDKIEVNRRINDNLTQQAQALFKSWVKIKCTDIINLSDIADFTSGYSYKGDELKPSKTAMATIKNFDRRGGFKLDGFKEVVPSNKLKESQVVNLYDILVAHTDITQNAEVIGNAEMLLSLGGYDRIIFSMDLVKVEPKKEFPYKFILAALLRTSAFKVHSLGFVNGTTVLHLSKKGLQDYKFVLTKNLEELNKMDLLLGDLYRRQAHIIEQNTILAKMRDTLLPRLMSGELEVKDIENSL